MSKWKKYAKGAQIWVPFVLKKWRKNSSLYERIKKRFFIRSRNFVKQHKGGDYIKIKAILKNKQPEDYKKLINFANEDKSDDELSFKDFEKMMKHDSYKRHKGAMRQVNHS